MPDRAGHGSAHQRELGELACGGADVGAEVEHDAGFFRVGHCPAIAGRSTPGMVVSTSLAMAIRAPVLPAETTKSASPFCTASIDSHMLDPRPRRSAWLGLSAHLHHRVGVDDGGALHERRMLLQKRLDAGFVAEKQEPHAGMALEGDGGTRHDDGRACVSPHGVKRYGSRCCHDPLSAAVSVTRRPHRPSRPISTAVVPKDARP